MKKLFLIPLMLLATLVFSSACSEDNPPMDGQEQNNPGGNEGNGNGDGNDQGGNVDGANERYLVLYCSRTGNTERMAQTIQSALDCDMIEVVPETPYEDDYNAMLDRAQAELDAIAQGNYPAITTSVESFDAYDIVFIGYPIWYSHIATPMQTFLHNHVDLLAGKRIALFASSGSSGIGTSERDAATLVPDAVFEESLLLTSSSLGNMATRIPQWLESLGHPYTSTSSWANRLSQPRWRTTAQHATSFPSCRWRLPWRTTTTVWKRYSIPTRNSISTIRRAVVLR